jgi:hypothetical protein
MSEDEVNTYLASLEEPKRSTLVALRRTILDIVPEVEQMHLLRRACLQVATATWPFSVYLIVLGVIPS